VVNVNCFVRVSLPLTSNWNQLQLLDISFIMWHALYNVTCSSDLLYRGKTPSKHHNCDNLYFVCVMAIARIILTQFARITNIDIMKYFYETVVLAPVFVMVCVCNLYGSSLILFFVFCFYHAIFGSSIRASLINAHKCF